MQLRQIVSSAAAAAAIAAAAAATHGPLADCQMKIIGTNVKPAEISTIHLLI